MNLIKDIDFIHSLERIYRDAVQKHEAKEKEMKSELVAEPIFFSLEDLGKIVSIINRLKLQRDWLAQYCSLNVESPKLTQAALIEKAKENTKESWKAISKWIGER